MGTGIAGVVPLIFTTDQLRFDKSSFTQGFFDNYENPAGDGRPRWVIKESVLIENYRPFLLEFYDLIGTTFESATEVALEDIPEFGDQEEFIKGFTERRGRAPFVCKDKYFFSTLGCVCLSYWVFYSGSYKAILEEYSTFVHFERILARVMTNPLGHSVKFGLFG